MDMTREDLHVFYHQIFQIVANKLGIKDFEWKFPGELAEEIANINSSVASQIDEFFKAYEEWFAVHEEIDSSGSQGNLTPEQNDKLQQVINHRDLQRQKLIDQVAKLG
jgi:hypothetical protein